MIGHALDVLTELPSGSVDSVDSVDCVVTSPPSGVESAARSRVDGGHFRDSEQALGVTHRDTAGLRPGSDGVTLGSLCTGYGGLDLGTLAAFGGGRVAWVADPDPHVRAILDARLPDVPNLGDITTTDWTTVEPVTVITAGFPCQDISAAGPGGGIRKGTRSGLWHQVIDAVRHLRPAILVVENVAALRWRNGGLDIVLADLAAIGYDAHWCCLRASDIGAAHRRERVFLLGYPSGIRFIADTVNADAAHPTGTRLARPGPGVPTAHRPVDRKPARHGLTTVADSPGTRSPLAVPAEGTRSGRTSGQPARHGDAAVADPARERHRHAGPQSRSGIRPTAVAAGAAAVPDPASDRWDQGQPQSAGIQGGSDTVLGGGAAAADAACGQQPQQPQGNPGLQFGPGTGTSHRDHPGHSPQRSVHLGRDSGGVDSGIDDRVAWGGYEVTIRRWERILGRLAPHPTEPGRGGRPRLSPAFVEWLMGLPPGWVTGIDIPRTAQLRALGNGVVPQQAAHALEQMLGDLVALSAIETEQEASAA